jgi:hypothetical protein
MATTVLVAHSAKEEQTAIDDIVAYLRQQMPGAFVSTAREQWQLRLSSAGSADQLAVELGAGSQLNGQPLFSLIVFPRPYVGKRSAITAEAALRAGRLVVYLDGVAFVPVGGIQTIDADDWQAGWLLHPASISPHGANGELT